jgi:hypothetical protein
MDVRRDDVVDRVGRQPGGGKRGEQARRCVVRPGVDERRAAALDDEVGGVEERPVKARVDDGAMPKPAGDESGGARQ